jgi:hypothetical protein
MKRSFAAPFLCWIFCAFAFSEERGIIQCDSGSEYVAAWAAPGLPHIVDRLKCSQMVNIIEIGKFVSPSQYSSRPSKYAKIQIGNKEAYVDAKYINRSEIPPPLKTDKGGKAAAEGQITKEDEERKKWDSITRENVKLRDEMLLDPMYTNGPSTFTATVSNNSTFPISQLQVLLRIYDCSAKPKGDYSNCEIIGEVKPFIVSSIPSGQTRRVTGSAMFEATPRVRGTFAWSYRILGICAE